MLTAKTSFRTENASRYLQQLCKHFGHKVDVQYDAEKGRVDFSIGEAELAAFADRLEFVAMSENEEGLERTKSVLENHLVRFAFREELTKLDWA